jgi:hypothetical protein
MDSALGTTSHEPSRPAIGRRLSSHEDSKSVDDIGLNPVDHEQGILPGRLPPPGAAPLSITRVEPDSF